MRRWVEGNSGGSLRSRRSRRRPSSLRWQSRPGSIDPAEFASSFRGSSSLGLYGPLKVKTPIAPGLEVAIREPTPGHGVLPLSAASLVFFGQDLDTNRWNFAEKAPFRGSPRGHVEDSGPTSITCICRYSGQCYRKYSPTRSAFCRSRFSTGFTATQQRAGSCE